MKKKKKNKCNLNIPLRFLWLHFFLPYFSISFHFEELQSDTAWLKSTLWFDRYSVKCNIWHYVNVWLFNKNLSYYFQGIYCGQQKLTCMGIGVEFEIVFTDVGELNFDKSFLYFNVKKKLYAKIALTVNIEY